MRRTHLISAALLAVAAAATTATPQAGDGAATVSELAARALELLEEGATAAGPLRLEAALQLTDAPASRPDLAAATLEILLPPIAGRLQVAVTLASFEIEPETLALVEQLPPGAGQGLVLRLRLEVPEEIDRVLVVAEFTDAGLWGASEAEFESQLPETDPGTPVVERDLRSAATREASTAAAAAGALRVLPPMDEPVSGPTRIRVLISDPAITRVRFELDGEAVAEDDSPPFAAVIDFGSRQSARELRAVGLDAAGRSLGEDLLRVNQRAGGPRIRIAELRAGGGRVVVSAELEPSGGPPPERVDLYLNDSLVASLRSPPWRAELSRPQPTASDFVRVVATFAGGVAVEDARLVEGATERVEVNLVQLFAVVTDRDGSPHRDLTADDFEIRLAGRRQPIERFARAQEVPLVLGLVIDTSGSMWTLMPDTRQAGASFLAQTLRSGDRAFLVDFDTRPRLAAALTDDLGELLKRFAGLTAEGFTALYDAVIFSMLQFESAGGRKALVVLTDGDDYKSRFGGRRCIEYGRELGVPVYIIALGGFHGERRDLRKLDLESLAGSTGGRVFYIRGSEELAPAYDRIQEELRSQYLLAFATPRPLSADELGRIAVTVRPRGLRVRAVAGLNLP